MAAGRHRLPFLHLCEEPAATDDGGCFQELHGAGGAHLAADDAGQIIFYIDEIDGNIVNEAIDVLAQGGIVLYPTDTVYGLGANIFDIKAVKRVFDIKQRSLLKPLSILVSDTKAIDLVAKVSLAQKEVINSHLPGPYTFILDKRKIVPRAVVPAAIPMSQAVSSSANVCAAMRRKTPSYRRLTTV